ncbi:MAG: response regulator, partial [Clostridia bacterium]|nr:response regulator [Clostridia bacterium]
SNVENADITGIYLLVAEDNEMNAEILMELLQCEGARCDHAENGRVAVEKFLAAPPDTYDLILMDIQMPEMNGHDATREIRSSDHPRAKSIPIAAMTANAFTEDMEAAFAAGMDAHIPKPVDMPRLKTIICELLEQKKE